MPDATVQTAASLRVAADLLEQHPTLPAPYVTSHTMTGEVRLSWYVNNDRDADHQILSAVDQGGIALGIFDALGGAWRESEIHTTDSEGRPVFHWQQDRGPLALVVQVHQADVVEAPC